MTGTALLHINGLTYELAESFDSREEPGFRALERQVERLIQRDSPVERFPVLLHGEEGALLVRSDKVTSAAVVFQKHGSFAAGEHHRPDAGPGGPAGAAVDEQRP
jgi:hypothetical protein